MAAALVASPVGTEAIGSGMAADELPDFNDDLGADEEEDLPDFDPDGDSDEPRAEAPLAAAAASLASSNPPGIAGSVAPAATTSTATASSPDACAESGAAAADVAQADKTGPQAGAALNGEPPYHVEDHLPEDDDKETWLEFLRDGYCRQLRCVYELQEPPPFQRVFSHVAAPGESCPEGTYPRWGLHAQLHLVRTMRWHDKWGEDGRWRDDDRRPGPYSRGGHGSWSDGWDDEAGPRASTDISSCADQLLPHLMSKLQAGGVRPSVLAQVRAQARSGQLNTVLAQVAQQMAALRAERAKSRTAEGQVAQGSAGSGSSVSAAVAS